jgi:hypothetical protein
MSHEQTLAVRALVKGDNVLRTLLLSGSRERTPEIARAEEPAIGKQCDNATACCVEPKLDEGSAQTRLRCLRDYQK